MQFRELNRIKVKLCLLGKRTIKWLTDELGKKTAIMSKWYTNVLYTFDKIARLFDIDIQEHITGTNWIYDR